ncbi:NAD-dependent protein deacetylase sirtuin-2 [Apophysomyces sp. BC1034]|nr:NAD-dependent protein deacetylase sirtuin-2 [Apophysomyces sp. BC1015]KAG0171970.1 NAD-dependent protein deacetylase sirtuin-2 [Apophysomyces sp. BC1021]KAG0184993.1 NAD-dependent protein deacetylase sirtuin-2 [Apophysomyces sp. BC1034]
MPSQRVKQNEKDKVPKLKSQTLSAVADYIKENDVKRIIVMSGAGISTAAGIPDFRSKKTGLYANLQKYDLPHAEAIFDIEYFMEKPEAFYTLAKELYPSRFLPTKTHYFIRLLHDKGVLLRSFTQNIDTLERLAGVPDEKLVEAHGSFATASCVKCRRVVDPLEIKEMLLRAEVLRCEDCKLPVKPDITFFGQSLPERFYDRIEDFESADLLIVIGTSLAVQPFASLVDEVPDNVPRLLINKELVGAHQSPNDGFDFKWRYGKKRDVALLNDCDIGVEMLAELLGWKDDLAALHKKGHAKLKAMWAAEKATEEEVEEDIDALAKELETKLNIPQEKEIQEEKQPIAKQNML